MPYADRRNPRLTTFDYRMPGPYFVTICLQNRTGVFGEVREGQVALNDIGEMIECAWFALPLRFPTVLLDAFITMPDHIHAIVALVQTGLELDADSPTLGGVIKAFKSITTNAYGRGVREDGWPRYEHRFWQTNYYEHIIRDDRDLDIRRAYIEGNPGRWQESRRGS